MTVQLVGDGRLTGEMLGARLRDIFAGSICSVLSIATGLSYAALIFSGPLAPWLGYGIAVTFFRLRSAPWSWRCAARSPSP